MLEGPDGRVGVHIGVLAFVLVLAVSSPALGQDEMPANGEGFVDIKGNIHEEDIRFIVRRGLTVGCDLKGPRYCPERPVTRAEMAAFLARALRLDTTLPFRGVYPDVAEGAWYAPFVEALGSRGLTDTELSGGYRPHDPMLRSEMAVFLQRAFRLPTSGDPSVSSFRDIPAEATYSDAAEAILQAGITRGCGTDPLVYCPDDTVKRDTMASFLARALRGSDLRETLALAPGREILQKGTSGDDTWKVWVCEGIPVQEDLVVYLNREISSYFRWLSGGEYRMRFEYGTDPSAEITAVLENCENRENRGTHPRGSNVFVGLDLGTVAYGVAGQGSWRYHPGSQTFSRNVWIDKRALYSTSTYAHEIGHTFGWPHNLTETGSSQPLQTGMDIMASLGKLVGTNAHNLFQVGWLDPGRVAVHTHGIATYTLAPAHSGEGRELLMLPFGSGRLISIGARVTEGFDKDIVSEGIELYR